MAEQLVLGPKAFVAGFPVKHSRSPLIHRFWLRQFGLQGSYQAIEISPERFPAFILSLRESGFSGGNVTIPHKETAYQLCTHKDQAAEEIGAVNTIWVSDGKLHGSNTDAYGFLANLDSTASGWDRGRTALVLGAGGASRAIIYALKQRGFSSIQLVNRTLTRARALADRFGSGITTHEWGAVPELLKDASMIVNTTSLGMDGRDDLTIDLSNASPGAIVTDIVYAPLETPLLRAARARGLNTVDGLGMLLHQAVPGFERWFSVCPMVTSELRNAVLADIATPSACQDVK